ncbi:MAG: efflux RND transporter periplasmic adaptor subunit [Muribaculaceae bacterium]|nr:efflux RND transporter periplasmic adaptor subunit [Muribaculaceae bacterium]
MKILYTLFISAALLVTACHGGLEANEHEHEHDHGHATHSHVESDEDEHAHHHDGEIEMHDHVAERMGVKLDTLRQAPFHSVVKASGKVISAATDMAVVSAPTAGIVRFSATANPGAEVAKGAVIAVIDAKGISGGDKNGAAKAALENARKELQRVESLYADRLATAGELMAAQAAVKQAEAEYSPAAADGQAKAPIAGAITELAAKEGQYVNAGDPLAFLGKSGATVLKVELPRRYYSVASTFTDLVVDIPGADPFSVLERGGKRLSAAPSGENSSTGAYIPLYFSLATTGAPAGTAFSANLIGTLRDKVLTIPVSALSEQQGQFFVYECHEEEHYVKKPVTLGQNDGRRVEVISGLDEGDVIVVEGVSAVRLAEVSAVAPEGHTHNH